MRKFFHKVTFCVLCAAHCADQCVIRWVVIYYTVHAVGKNVLSLLTRLALADYLLFVGIVHNSVKYGGRAMSKAGEIDGMP